MATLTLPADAVLRMFGATIPHVAKKNSHALALEFVRVTVRSNLAVATATDRYTLAMHAEHTECEDLEVLVSLDEAKAAIAFAKAAGRTEPVRVPGIPRGHVAYPNLSRIVRDEGYEPGAGSREDGLTFPAPSQVVKIDKTVRALKLKDSDLWVAHRPKTGILRFDIGTRTSVWLMPRQQAESSSVLINWESAAR